MRFSLFHPTRREIITSLGLVGGAALASCKPRGAGYSGSDSQQQFRTRLERLVFDTPFVDTHEHLPDERDRLRGVGIPCDDWAVLFSQYLSTELLAAGMPANKLKTLLSPGVATRVKWRALKRYWPTVKETGYGQAIQITLRDLYGIDELKRETVDQLQSAYETIRKPGFYREILVDRANISSCQVNGLGQPFHESSQPTLLMQDLDISNLQAPSRIDRLAGPTGITVTGLSDWHGVIRWWFDRYGRYAVAVKSQRAYQRGLDYAKVGTRQAAPLFAKLLQQGLLNATNAKHLEDHLFWFCVDQANALDLPVKLHTGILWKPGKHSEAEVDRHPEQLQVLCHTSPETRFVLLHSGHSNWQEMIRLAENQPNAYLEMSWSWILDPSISKEFLKSYLQRASPERILTFGGDYVAVEPVLGQATLARRGIVAALAELVEQGSLAPSAALDSVAPLMHGNADRLFDLDRKTTLLEQAPWPRSSL
jgi:predicted TIM-barrel fold metal-dependent hydrolase